MSLYPQNKSVNKYVKQSLKSIYLNHLLTGGYPQGYNILHAREEALNSERDTVVHNTNQRRQITHTNEAEDYTHPVEFEYIAGSSSVKLKRKIFPLKEAEIKSKAIAWCENFSVSSKLANWSTNDSLEILQSLIPPHVISEVLVIGDLEGTFDKIKALQLGTLSLPILLNELKLVKQENFYFIITYYNVILDIITKMSLINRYSKKETENKLLESFISGLHSETQLELQKLNINTVEDIVKFIQKQEEILIANPQQPSQSIQYNNKTTTFRSEFYKKITTVK